MSNVPSTWTRRLPGIAPRPEWPNRTTLKIASTCTRRFYTAKSPTPQEIPMKDRDVSSKRSATGARTVVEPGRLLVAVSLLGASLGVAAAAPTQQIGGPERAAETRNVEMKLAKRKAWVRPGVSNQVKSDQKKGTLPAVQNTDKK
jgi:hypothetical protein